MKKISSFKKQLIVILAFALFLMHLHAQNKIEFKWQAFSPPKSFTFAVTENKPFTVHWGDEVVETYFGGEYELRLVHTYSTPGFYRVSLVAEELDCKFYYLNVAEKYVSELQIYDCDCLLSLYCDNNQLTNLDLSGCNAIEVLSFGENSISSIDISMCTNLELLTCSDNQVKELNFSNNQVLEWLECQNNQITELDLTNLKNLYAVICMDNNLKNLRLSGCSALNTISCSNNQLTSIDVHGKTDLVYLFCSDNQFVEIDLSGCYSLRLLECTNNKISTMKLVNCNQLTTIICKNNRLKLSDLYTASQIVGAGYKYLGTQNLPPQTAHLETELFTDQSCFNGIFTNYVVEKDGISAPDSDFRVEEGKLYFFKRGFYTVTMTNDAIDSHTSAPAEVIVTLDVLPVSIEANELQSIKVYPNPTTGELRVVSDEIKVNTIEVYDIYGRMAYQNSFSNIQSPFFINISHLPAGVYFLRNDKSTVKVIKN